VVEKKQRFARKDTRLGLMVTVMGKGIVLKGVSKKQGEALYETHGPMHEHQSLHVSRFSASTPEMLRVAER
jgi:hypothetical protein